MVVSLMRLLLTFSSYPLRYQYCNLIPSNYCLKFVMARLELKAAATDMGYFARIKFSGWCLVYKKFFGLI